MTDPVAERRKLTYEDYLNIPGDTRHELIDGRLTVPASPTPYHRLRSGGQSPPYGGCYRRVASW